MNQAIATDKAPAAIGPYAQGVEAGNLVFCSGQLPVDTATGEIPDGISAQTEHSLKNVQAVLTAAGCTMNDVVKTTCFLQDMGDFAAFNEVYARFFTDSKPARSTVAVRELPKGALVEIEAIAVKS